MLEWFCLEHGHQDHDLSYDHNDAFGNYDPYTSDNAQNTYYDDRELENFKSIKNVFQNRPQFKRKKEEKLKAYREFKNNSSVSKRRQAAAFANKSNKLNKSSSLNKSRKGKGDFNDSSDKVEIDEDEHDPQVFRAHGKTFRFVRTSLNLLSNKNYIRRFCVWLCCWKWFEIFIIALIILNSLFLGMMDYTDKEDKGWRNKLVVYTEPVFTVIFTIECVVKIVGMGLIIGKGTYLSDPWNWIDFIVVISGLLSVFPQMANVSGLRTFRLFRPLRSLSQLENIRILIGTLLASVSQLGGVLSLAIFFFLIFAILGVNLYAGTGHYR